MDYSGGCGKNGTTEIIRKAKQTISMSTGPIVIITDAGNYAYIKKINKRCIGVW